MKMFNRFGHRATLCAGALLLCFSLAAGADELQDINKLFKQGSQEQAMTRVNAYLEKKPKDAQARFLKGLIFTEQGKATDAIKEFTSLTEDYPELPEPYNNLAVLYANQGQYDKARIALEMAIRTNPSYATAHENLGDIYAKMASQAYDRALQLDHGNTATQTKLSMIKDIFASNGRGDKASKPARKPVVAAAETKPAESKPAESKPATETVASAAPAQPTASTVAAAEPAKVAEPAPETKKPSSPSRKNKVGSTSKDVLKMLDAWAAAWSEQDVKTYLGFYADSFDLPSGVSRAEWEVQRGDRVKKPKFIKVAVSHASVKFQDDNHASVTFKQSYRASHMHASSSKTLMLVKTDAGWQIQEERAK